MTYRLAFTDDPAEFLEVAGEHLAADPVLNTVLATVTIRAARAGAQGKPKPEHPEWWVTVLDGDTVAGVAMRTAPFRPYPLYVLPMPDEAAVHLGRTVVERGEVAPANGALPAARLVSEEIARSSGGTASVTEHMRLFECREVIPPASPPGRLRLATPDDAELCLAWYQAFEAAASEQAGRPHRLGGGEHFDAEFVAGRIEDGCIHLWETPAGDVVHLTAAGIPAFGVSRVGPVYTPTEHRGAGYASAAVAEVTRQILRSDVRACLFTDQANPTSNRIYQAIGYEPVVDMANHEVV
jgi:hypothetical protein